MTRNRTFARFRPRKDIGQRYSDHEFAEEFIEPVVGKTAKSERTPGRHSKSSHDMQYFPGE